MDRDPDLSRATILFWMGKPSKVFIKHFFLSWAKEKYKNIHYVLRCTCLYIIGTLSFSKSHPYYVCV